MKLLRFAAALLCLSVCGLALGQVLPESKTGSIVVGSPAGGNCGVGCINAQSIQSAGSYKIGANNAIQFPGGDTSSVAVGTGAGGNAGSTFGWNTAVGFNAMENSTACFGGSGLGYDVAIGWESLIVDAGCENTGVGVNTLLANTTGNFNIAIGNDAMSFSTTQSASIGIGHSACGGGASDGASTGSSNMCIGASAGGYMSGAASFNAFIGATSGQGAVGNQNTASNNTGLGWGTLQDVTTGTSNTCIGFAACEGSLSAPLTGAANTVLGANALELAQGSATHNNVAIGYNSMASATGANYDNCTGDHACSNLVSGYFNVVDGPNAGQGLTSGFANTIIGYGAAVSTLATGNDNLIIGTGSSTCDTASASTSNTVELCAGSTGVLLITGGSTPASSVTKAAGLMNTNSVAIGSLPSCASGTVGEFASVNNGVTSPTYFGAVSTTGTATDPVYCNYNGSTYQWVYH